MKKKYSIEVPIYSGSIEHLVKLNRREDVDIVLYGSVPGCALNGGRLNYTLDGLFLWDRFFFRLTEKQLARVSDRFYETLARANEGGVSFRAALTNMFVSPEELSDENLSAVDRMVESSRRYGVKNGVILNNKLLEGHLRQKYGDKLIYVSSCTKYVSAHRILTPRETLRMYLEDSGKYDFICLTPQDSRREDVIREVVRNSSSGIIAIANSYCADRCNSYHHYEFTSRENKKSLLTTGTAQALAGAFGFTFRRALKCSAFGQAFRKVDIGKLAGMQLKAGIVHFKLGRGIGAGLVDQLVSLISS